MPVTEVTLHGRPVAWMPGIAPGQGVGCFDGSVRLVGRSPGAAVRLERDHVGQAGLAQCEVPGVADGVGAVGDHRAAAEARLLPAGREVGGQLRFGAEGRVGAAAGEVVGGGVGSGVQRVVHTAVGPHRGHRDDAVVRLAQPAQPLPAHVCGGGAVLAVPGVVDHDAPAVVRSRRRLLAQQFKPPVVDLLGLPGRFGQEEQQPLHLRHPRTGHRFRPGQTGDRLVPLP